MKQLLIIALVLTSCGGIQTDPTCKVEQFGIITIRNNTDEWKDVYFYRVIHDGERYKRVGDPEHRHLEPLTEVSHRIHPGIVLVVINFVQGKTWMETFHVKLCNTAKISMKNPVLLRDIEIKSRRSEEPKCPPGLSYQMFMFLTMIRELGKYVWLL